MRVKVGSYSERAEKALLPLAESYTPEGSQPLAVVHQWLHATVFGDKSGYFGLSDTEAGNVVVKTLESAHLSLEEIKSDLLSSIVFPPPEQPAFRFIDLFAGIGGMRIAAQQNGGTCVFSSEFEKFAQATYHNNYGEYPFGDLTKIEPDDIPEHDLLIAGFPCQPFSHAGLKLGIEDTRGTLFHNIAEILATRQPKVALLENVKGLVSHDKGYTLQVILRVLSKMGYSCNISKDKIFNATPADLKKEASSMVLKSIDFGVPQNRQRIYIVLWKNGICDGFDYPDPISLETRVGDVLEKKPLPKYTISDRLWEGHQRRKKENKANGKGFGYGIFNENSPYTNTISARYYKDGSEILIEQEGSNPRKITPREAARIQGFPESFKVASSDGQAYRQFGNSVSVPVVKYVIDSIYEQILG